MPKPLKFLSILTVWISYSLLASSQIFAEDCPPTLTNPGRASTGLGFCNDVSASSLVNNIVNIAIGASGGVAFLLLVYGGFRMVASQGDPKALQEARGIIMSAISGLLFIVFSVFILKLIGFTVLGVF